MRGWSGGGGGGLLCFFMLSCYSVWLSRGRTFKRPYDAFPAHERPTKGKGRGKECHTQESSMSSVRMAGLQAASRHGACVVLLFVDVRSSKSDFKFDLKAAPSTLKLSSVSYREVVNQNLALPYRSPASTCDTRIGIRHPHCCSAFLVLASLCRFPHRIRASSRHIACAPTQEHPHRPATFQESSS